MLTDSGRLAASGWAAIMTRRTSSTTILLPVKSEKMAGFYEEAKRKARRFKLAYFIHVPREHPKLRLADKLANKAIDEAKR